MKRHSVHICCRHYFDEELINLDRIEEVMSQIEEGGIRRPEFVLDFPIDSGKPRIVAAALFREGGEEDLIEGWLVRESVKGAPDQIVYCFGEYESAKKPTFKRVVDCGSPQKVEASAILSKAQAAILLKLLAKGEAISGFWRGSSLSVIRDD